MDILSHFFLLTIMLVVLGYFGQIWGTRLSILQPLYLRSQNRYNRLLSCNDQKMYYTTIVVYNGCIHCIGKSKIKMAENGPFQTCWRHVLACNASTTLCALLLCIVLLLLLTVEVKVSLNFFKLEMQLI